MATGWTAIILLSVAGSGSTLECFESVCFPHERADCVDPEAMESKTCDRETAFYVMSRKLGEEHVLRVNTTVAFNCVNFIGTSSEPGLEDKKMNLRLCHPRVENQCAMMEKIFDRAIKKAGVLDLKMNWECRVCREDGCNTAGRVSAPAVLTLACLAIRALP